jgi:hypothetical protein
MKGKRRFPEFTDKTALLLLLMLSDPNRRWHVRDFHGVGVSTGRASEILTLLHSADLVKREHRGKLSYTALLSPPRVIGAWTEKYAFSMNRCYAFRSEGRNVLAELKKLYQKKQAVPYALTLHTGANLVAPYVKSDVVHSYLNPRGFGRTLSRITKALGLRQVIDSGNIHFYEPFYKDAAFENAQSVRGYRVVSNLQMYLDLFHHGLRGYEHAIHLKRTLEERGIALWSPSSLQ